MIKMNQTCDTAILTCPILRDRAKGALAGKYGKVILAGFSVTLFTLAANLLIQLFTGFLFGIFLIMKNLDSGITTSELLILLESADYLAQYQGIYNTLDYVLSFLLSIFTSVFHIGLCLLFLNIACGHLCNITDIFYGFRHQLGRSLCLTAANVCVNKLLFLPTDLLSYWNLQDLTPELFVKWLAATILCMALFLPLQLGLSQSFFLMLDFPNRSAGELLRLSMQIMRGHKVRLLLLRLSFLPLMLLSILSFGIGNLWLTPYQNATYAFFFLNLMQTREKGTP